MTDLVRKMLSLLERREKMQALGLLCLMVVMSFIEVLGIASILPFMAVLSSPESIQTNQYLRAAYEFLGFDSTHSFLFALGFVVLIVLVISNALKALTKWMILRFSHMQGYRLSRRLFSHYLNQPYSFFIAHHSSTMTRNILGEVQGLTAKIMIPFMEVISRVLISIMILILLVIVDPLLALGAVCVLGVAFVGVYIFFQKRLLSLGQVRYDVQAERFKLVNEAMQGIKNIKLTGTEPVYRDLFKAPSLKYARTQSNSGAISELPHYALEIIAFGGILLIVLYLLLTRQGLENAMPLMALYAFAGYRLMPSLQAIYKYITKIRFNMPVLDTIHAEITGADGQFTTANVSQKPDDQPAMTFAQDIKLENIHFRYQDARHDILSGVSLTIPVNTTIGIVGKTGSGKTTLIDIILGLLRPSAGRVVVDGVDITDDNLRAWQKNLAYVSQHIYLCDDTVRRNIAFGVPDDEIDEAQMRRAAQMACIDEFITTDLPNAYDTVIGENGIRLSGGQRQRIGLARALYLNRPVLVLDEATSALDAETENSVMKAIDALSHQKTIIMIAHRLSTIEKCDFVFRVDNGRITKVK